MPPPPCTSCHIACIRTQEEFYVKCSECNRCWHDGCLYEKIRNAEIQERTRLYSYGTIDGSWLDWTCRRCKKQGEEGKEFRPVKQPAVHDLTADSDDDEDGATGPKPAPDARALSTIAPQPAPAPTRTKRVPMKSAPISPTLHPPPPKAALLPTKQAENRPASAKVPPTANSALAPSLRRRVPMKSAASAYRNSYAPPPKATVSSSKPPYDKDVVDLVSSDDEVQIVDPPDKSRNSTRPPEMREPPTPNNQDQLPLDTQEQPVLNIQDPPTLDIRDLSLEEPVYNPPLPEFPSPGPTPFEHRLGPTVAAPRPAAVLPPALRPSTRSILGQRLIGAIEKDRIVQMVGLEALKSGRWKLDSRGRESVSIEPNPPRLGLDKGKGRAVGERTRDWTPLLQQEQARERQAQHLRLQVATVMHLVPPGPQTTNPTLIRNAYPPRKPRKAATVVHRDNTVKLEPVEFSFS